MFIISSIFTHFLQKMSEEYDSASGDEEKEQSVKQVSIAVQQG